MKNVVFDLGGVLVEWNPGAIAAALSADPAVQQSIVSGLLGHADWRAYDRGEFTLAQVLERFRGRTALDIGDADTVFRTHIASLHPMRDSIRLLEDLEVAGVGVYCLSNVSRPAFEAAAARHAFFSRFRGVVISGDLGLGKPDPAIFRHLLSVHGLEAVGTTMIDDNAENVEAARRVGMRGILFTSAAACRAQLLADPR